MFLFFVVIVEFAIFFVGGTFGELALESGRDWGPPEIKSWKISSALHILIVEVGQDELLGHDLEGVLLVLNSP